jgi:hypothetical protein
MQAFALLSMNMTPGANAKGRSSENQGQMYSFILFIHILGQINAQSEKSDLDTSMSTVFNG